MKLTEKTGKKEKELLYGKEQLLQAGKYEKQQDLVQALLKDDEVYTLSQVDSVIRKFLKGKVI